MTTTTPHLPQVSAEQKEKGKRGEKALRGWLDEHSFSYLCLNQDQETFPKIFKSENVKRPDFLVVIDSIGLIAVDVKNYNRDGPSYALPIDSEFEKVMGFESLFRLPIWFVYFDEDENTWYWISALKAVKVGRFRKGKNGRSDFYSIRIEEFVEIHTRQDFGKLFTHSQPVIKKKRGPILTDEDWAEHRAVMDDDAE